MIVGETGLVLPAWIIWSSVVVIGSIVGSFLNVVIYRLPREQSIVRPRSHCTKCRKTIAWYDNIPVISFLLLKARCRHCKASIHWRYPVVEAFTAGVTVVVVATFGLTILGLVYAAFIWALIAASVIDLDFQIIPDEISLGGLVVGLLLSLAIPMLHGTEDRVLALGRSGVGLLVGGGALYLTGMFGDFVFRKESMGGGDIKLLAMAGTILGWKAVLVTFFIAPMFALGPGLIVLLTKRSHIIPYGPFLSIALVVSLFFGDAIIKASGMGETIPLLWEYYGFK